MKSVRIVLTMVAIAAGFSGCAQPERAGTVAKPSLVGSRFDEVGKVTLHAGQPCTSQIMFDFEGANSRRGAWLAAPMKESKVLTDAATQGRRVHVRGTWRRGNDKTCPYVEVTNVSDR